MTIKDLNPGQSAVIKTVGGEGALRQHFLDMGVIPGAKVTVVKLAPLGDPMGLRIHGYELTLRLADAEKIEAERIEEAAEVPHADARKRNRRILALARRASSIRRARGIRCRRERC